MMNTTTNTTTRTFLNGVNVTSYIDNGYLTLRAFLKAINAVDGDTVFNMVEDWEQVAGDNDLYYCYENMVNAMIIDQYGVNMLDMFLPDENVFYSPSLDLNVWVTCHSYCSRTNIKIEDI